MKVIKRNGLEVEFNPEKIKNAISKANAEVDVKDQLSNREIEDIVTGITETIKSMSRAVSVEEIQDTVESRLMRSRSPEVARKYIRYRYDREKVRNSNTTDDAILTLIERENVSEVVTLCHLVKLLYPDKSIWLYTGYKYEDISEKYPDLLDVIDVMVDGPFIEDLKDISLTFRGSSNQRIIDVPESLKTGRVVEVEL